MAWIKMVAEEDATGLVKEAYDAEFFYTMQASVIDGHKEVAEVVKVLSLRPDLLQARASFNSYKTTGGFGLGRYREELLLATVSSIVGCQF